MYTISYRNSFSTFWGIDRFPSVVVASSHRPRPYRSFVGGIDAEHPVYAWNILESDFRGELISLITYDLGGHVGDRREWQVEA